MPTYEYLCQDCGHEMEAFQRMSDAPLVDCPECRAPALKRKIGRGAGIIFKGGGFYETDFKDRKGKPDSGSSGAAKSSSPAESKADKPAEKKAEAPAKPAAKADA